jgi:diguanylate cyclase (GGDEF)-like protein
VDPAADPNDVDAGPGAATADILVVDDVPANVRLLTVFLRAAGHRVRSASSGLEALDRVAERLPDLILLDVMMPSLDGFETCRRLKADPMTRHVPVILVTSLNAIEDKVRGQEAGADDFVSKPFDRTELLLRIKSLLRISNMHGELQQRIGELEDAKSRLGRLARTDSLTSLYNRRFLEEAIVRELSRAQRYERDASVILLDVDHFKRCNDTRGHGTGDVLLQQLASLFTRQIRGNDLVARCGGDEFAMILPETPKTHAGLVAERLRVKIAEHEFLDSSGGPIERITVSMGIATFPEDATNAQELLEVADARLYLAKQRGRDRVELADAPKATQAG